MIALIEQAAEVQRFLADRRWRSCVIGGLAVIRWGEPRFTQDVDISLFAGFGDESAFASALIARFEPRIGNAVDFAVANRVVLLRGATGIPIDIALSGFPFEEDVIERATDFEYVPGMVLKTAGAEDLVVLKAFANRGRDWTDIEGIATRQRSLDWAAVLERLAPLVELKGEAEIMDRLAGIRESKPPR
ncbi:MAG: nucleotidyl transferase AbiEii/AbiGii toxin family protein [Gemmatimonadaceae bacterium]